MQLDYLVLLRHGDSVFQKIRMVFSFGLIEAGQNLINPCPVSLNQYRNS